MESREEIDETQNLSYLQPTHEYTYETKLTNAFVVQNFDVKVEGIEEGRGIWVVEFEGEGISSRAFIRKGVFGIVSTNNSLGNQISFFDENGAKLQNYDLWIVRKKHTVKDNFVIPYGLQNTNLDVVVLKDGYAQKFQVFVPSE